MKCLHCGSELSVLDITDINVNGNNVELNYICCNCNYEIWVSDKIDSFDGETQNYIKVYQLVKKVVEC